MPNPEIEQLIADALRNGIVHPGDPLKRIEPRPLRLPFKPSPGMPKEMTDLLEETTKQLAEAIVHLIEAEGGCELVPREELRALRFADSDGDLGRSVPVYCRCDASTPLMVLSVRDPQHIVIDGSAIIRQLHKRESAHPHSRIDGQ
jgi:hypothetical protein